MSEARTKVLVPAGMLGSGFPAETVARGIALGAHVIAVDGGSTDSGPYYLGAATAKTSAAAVRRDLEILVPAAREAGLPLIVGSCGTSGTDAGVDWVADMVRAIAADLPVPTRLARIYSEQPPARIVEALKRGEIRPLPPAGELDPATVERCSHVVALMGYEPIAAALEQGADIVLAGRATDAALLAAVPLLRGCPPGPSWHASKIAECGGLCTTSPTGGGVLVTVDEAGFTVAPLSLTSACTPDSVAAHMLYENADPFVMYEPGGTMDATEAVYRALDERRVRVTGSRFDMSPRYTNKLEGSAVAGYETMSLGGIRDPHVLENIEVWSKTLESAIEGRVRTVLGLTPADYEVSATFPGWNAVLGEIDDATAPPREVGVLLRVRAQDQPTATAIAKIANPLLLHLPLPGMTHLPSFAFPLSPAETERGAVYEFVLQHVIEVDSPHDLFRTEFEGLGR